MRFVTPSVTRFAKEGRQLVTAAPESYITFVRCTVGFGALMLFIGLCTYSDGAILGHPGSFYLFVGTMVLAAGCLASYMLDFADFDLREKTYRRRCGSWPNRRMYKGSLTELGAIVITLEPSREFEAVRNTFVVRAHWQNHAEPPTEMLRLMMSGFAQSYPDAANPTSFPQEYLMGMDAAMKYASALQIQLYNSTGLPVPQMMPGQYPAQAAGNQNWGGRP